ncbi:tail fiber domain-containing protein [Escherichia coli]|uniref:tail fiber domain-containing protein n=1 Tax=Escherichia coli TaxID=562 RepID=UPI002022D73D|nr:tail fiber domain-containing protein [Escherichia coli]
MIYTTGTIAISGNTVTGTGTNFSAPLSLIRVGCTLIAIGNPVQIFTITEIKSGTELSVTPAANPAIPAGTKFSILLSDSISVDGLAQDVAETLRYYQGKETEIAAAVEWWKDFGGDGQMDQLLADIRAETAKSTANAQKTEADKKTTEGYKNAAATSATAAKSSQDAAKASETSASNSKTAAATSETNAAQSAAAALNYRNQAQAIVGTDIGLSANPRDCPDISGNPSGYIGFLRIMEGATGWPSIASGERYLSGFICPTLGGVPTFSGFFIGHITGRAYTYKWTDSTGPLWYKHTKSSEIDRYEQLSDSTAIYNASKSASFVIKDTKAWGVWDLQNSEYIPLAIAQGGTGGRNANEVRKNIGLGDSSTPQFGNISLKRTNDSTSGWVSGGLLSSVLVGASGSERVYGAIYPETNLSSPDQLTLHLRSGGVNRYASLNVNGEFIADSFKPKSPEQTRRNINIPTIGGGELITITAPSGVEAGKYYPIIVNANYYSAYRTGYQIDIHTKSASGSDPMNCNAFTGYVRTGGWSDRKDSGYGYYNRYVANEIALHSICSPGKDNDHLLFVFVEARAFPVTMRLPVGVTAEAPAAQVIYNEGKDSEMIIPWGVSDPLSSHKNLNVMFDFRLGRCGFYSATTEGLYYICSGGRVGLFNGITVGEEISMTMPKLTINGRICSSNAFFAGGDNTEKVSFISQLTVNGVKHQSEFRTGETCGQVVVRDFSDSAAHRFFNFNKDGTFSSPSGNVTHTGADWNGQQSDNVNKFKPIAGNTNGPDGSGVFGGFHVSFSGNYATQFAGRNSKFYARSFEAGVDKGWCQLATLNASSQRWTGYQQFKSTEFFADTYTRKVSLAVANSAVRNGELYLWGAESRPTVFEYKIKDPDTNASLSWIFYAQQNTDDSCQFQVNGAVNCVTVNQSSDRDLKDNIQVIGDATEAIRKMNGYTYTLKENGLPYAGVIAQEVMEALPEAVGSFTHYGEALQGPTIDGNELREETRYLNVDYAAVTGLLVQVARETDNRVTELEEENASLRANIAVMDERITKLEALVRQLTGSEE